MPDWIPLVESRTLQRKVPGLYVFRNKNNQKVYVGMSNDVRHRINVHRRAKGASALLHRAIRKHGVEAFEVCLYLTAPFEDLPELERMLIEELGSMVPAGYNLTAGGEGNLGWKMGAEQKEQLRKNRAGKKLSAETKALIAEANKDLWTPEMRAKAGSYSKGRIASDETRERMAQANRDRPDSWRQKVGEAHTGRKASEETKAKQSHSAQNRTPEHRQRISEANSGKYPSQQTRDKMSASQRKRVLMWPSESMLPREFASCTEAADFIGKTAPFVSLYCSGKLTPKDGSVFVYDK